LNGTGMARPWHRCEKTMAGPNASLKTRDYGHLRRYD
jgi:hypothetical protein